MPLPPSKRTQTPPSPTRGRGGDWGPGAARREAPRPPRPELLYIRDEMFVFRMMFVDTTNCCRVGLVVVVYMRRRTLRCEINCHYVTVVIVVDYLFVCVCVLKEDNKRLFHNNVSFIQSQQQQHSTYIRSFCPVSIYDKHFKN